MVLDRVRQNYNIGAIFRLCDAFLAERLIVAGTSVNLRSRKLIQTARGTQRWVPWSSTCHATNAIAAAKSAGSQIIVVEQTTNGIKAEALSVSASICLVLGSEVTGSIATSSPWQILRLRFRCSGWRTLSTSPGRQQSSLTGYRCYCRSNNNYSDASGSLSLSGPSSGCLQRNIRRPFVNAWARPFLYQQEAVQTTRPASPQINGNVPAGGSRLPASLCQNPAM